MVGFDMIYENVPFFITGNGIAKTDKIMIQLKEIHTIMNKHGSQANIHKSSKTKGGGLTFF